MLENKSVFRSRALERLRDDNNHSPADIYFVKRSMSKLEACLSDTSKINNMLKRADQGYVKRFKTFGLDFSDLDALKESLVPEKQKVSPRDPFLSYGKSRRFRFKHEPIKPIV